MRIWGIFLQLLVPSAVQAACVVSETTCAAWTALGISRLFMINGHLTVNECPQRQVYMCTAAPCPDTGLGNLFNPVVVANAEGWNGCRTLYDWLYQQGVYIVQHTAIWPNTRFSCTQNTLFTTYEAEELTWWCLRWCDCQFL